MTRSEKAALRHIQDENFRLRVELDHERGCMEIANRHLGSIPAAMGRLKTTIPGEIASLIDDAIKALNEPVPK